MLTHERLDLLKAQAFFTGLTDDQLAQVAGCARLLHVPDGMYLAREGEPADSFFVVRSGRVALELHRPGAGSPRLDVVHPGDVVGWSWLVPPYRWFLDARAVGEVSVLAVDAACLRSRCDDDPALGFALLQRVTSVMYERLQSARLRLLDLYGTPHVHLH